jgi:hypothetical protein
MRKNYLLENRAIYNIMRKNCFLENRAICDIMWENYGNVGQTAYENINIRVACCVPKAEYTHSEYVTHSFFTATMFA